MSAKFRIPELVRSVVMRPRLLNRLTAAVRGPLTLVSAPAGAGKTVMVSSWIAARCWPGPVAWITLDGDDDQPAVFWSYVLEGLARSGVAVPEVGQPGISGAVDKSVLIRLSACLSERLEPCVLVLDRAERLTDPTVLEQIDFVIAHAAPQLRVVLITRVDPRLPLHRYRLAGSMTEIRIDELAFSIDEARQLLSESNVVLSEEALQDMCERTRGWAAGLRMATIAIEDGADGDETVRRFGGDQRAMAGYFIAEVLDTAQAWMRQFLLRTSVVDELYPELAEKLAERTDASHILASMADAGHFIEAVNGGRSYRYHPLFRELLVARTAYELPGDVASLHEKAAAWLADTGRVDEAVRHAAHMAGNWTLAAALAVGHFAVAGLLVPAAPGALAESFAGMPDDLPGAEPAVVLAAMALARQDLDACGRYLARAEEIVDDGTARKSSAIQLAIAVVQTLAACHRNDLDGAAVASADVESRLVDLDLDYVVVPAELRALVHIGLGGAQLRTGNVADAAASFVTGARISDVPGCERLRLDCLSHLALIHAMRGRLRRAADLARRACAVADGCGLADADLPAAIDVAHAWISTERCDIRAALAHTERATATTMISGDPVLSAALALVRARLLRMRGEFAAAREALRAERLATASTPVPGWLEQRLIAAETSLAITVGRRDTPAPESADPDTPGSPPSAIVLAWATLERHDAVQTIHHATEDLHNEVLPLDRRVDAWLLTAASHLVHDRPHLARAAIDQALRLAEPDQLRRPILEAPPTVRRLIRHDPHFADTHHWLLADDTVATRAHRPTAPTAFVMFQPLTEKENEVLHLLAALLSTEEIAKRMFISVNTVKTHVRGILRKLSAVRRNEAVRRAREFGLI